MASFLRNPSLRGLIKWSCIVIAACVSAYTLHQALSVDEIPIGVGATKPHLRAQPATFPLRDKDDASSLVTVPLRNLARFCLVQLDFPELPGFEAYSQAVRRRSDVLQRANLDRIESGVMTLSASQKEGWKIALGCALNSMRMNTENYTIRLLRRFNAEVGRWEFSQAQPILDAKRQVSQKLNLESVVVDGARLGSVTWSIPEMVVSATDYEPARKASDGTATLTFSVVVEARSALGGTTYGFVSEVFSLVAGKNYHFASSRLVEDQQGP